jgi:hypothetical protein
MSEARIEMLFVDTSSLRQFGLQHPDLQKLFKRSKGELLQEQQSLQMVISEIAWEEFRTSMRDNKCKEVRALRSQFDKIVKDAASHEVLKRLPSPALAIWEETAIDAAFKESMSEFAREHRIKIIPTGGDHGERVWRRYFHFKIEPPFSPEKSRENRRKDIPDAWIFEVAADLVADGQSFAALCFDDNLATALQNIGVRVYRTPGEVVNELERAEAPREVAPRLPGNAEVAANPLSVALGRALDPFRAHEERVLGFVAYIGAPSRQELLDSLQLAGMPAEIAKNAIDRLVLMGVLRDTGNHYLITDRTLAAPAAASVEGDFIRLLIGEAAHGL